MGDNHGDRKHATLSPSTSERWFACPGSIRLSKGKRSTSGAAALLGTEAHEYASEILLENQTVEDIPEVEMRRAVERYIEFIGNLEDSYEGEFDYMIEDQVDLSHLGGDVWGTLDYASWIEGKDLYVIDYKHGIVTVEAKDNKQLLIYALGLLEKIGYDFKYVYIVIAQPRAAHTFGSIRSCRYTIEAMQKFRKILKKAIAATKKKDAPLHAGAWCQYCPAIGGCPKVVKTAQNIARIEFNDGFDTGENKLPVLDSISDDQLTKIVEHIKMFKSWLEGCELEAVRRLDTGKKLGELKLVRSPGRARWRNPEDLPPELTVSKPMTITEAKAQFDDIEEFIERPEGKIVAASSEDGRALYISAKTEFG